MLNDFLRRLTAGVLLVLCQGQCAAGEAGQWGHAWAGYGEPKYPAGYSHLDWVNPNAPKGGTLVLRNPDRRSSFDKFNPFTPRGAAPTGVMLFMFETLAVMSGDEPQTMYGLLAEAIRVAPDKSAVSFRLHPRASFSNGEPVTAADVKYSYDMQAGPASSPASRMAWRGVERVVVLDDRTVRFDLRQHTTDMVLATGNVRVFSRKWGGGKPFDEVVSEPPITSGPYVIGAVDMGRSLELKRNPSYWAKDLGARRGMFNFDRVIYRYYKDTAVAREAFKAGEVDIFLEGDPGAWTRLHTGRKWQDGRIRKETFATEIGVHMVSYAFNMRRPVFQDRRVRQALDLSFDFDTLNRQAIFRRAESLFSNSEFAAAGSPTPGELALLKPHRAELPEAVFGLPYVAPRTQGDPRQLRRHLLQARALLEQAGWTLDSGGVMRNARGQPMVLEFLTTGPTGQLTEWQANLERLGIRLIERVVDSALMGRRMERQDFDLYLSTEGTFTLPSATQLAGSYGSSPDGKTGSRYRGIQHPVVDALLKTMSEASTQEELRNATRALDRVVMWNHWGVPYRFSADARVSYWNRFGQPTRRPRLYVIDSVSTNLPAWPLLAWWALPGAPR
ncbi:extracellular solute-binding protein [Roseateles toxinivorans]|uniref:Peptide/nickel transport system substrate-binding protein/microcin C transport system substrate-binding protein n=1 Tax=Roseateles toxinivorans TaxID=270368 RepID=A0A4R6QNM6_9BURK|nr:extracellular solute-binding protein [Roseateles toxinivorans]TDP72263.1 peptide/nickel transport system substrate-binding protein/microcin C transport system substrate-binding protein [Roseateles toxinivorans]